MHALHRILVKLEDKDETIEEIRSVAYISDYYLQTVPESVKAAWQETLEETGFNPFQTDVTSTLTQLSVEQDFLFSPIQDLFRRL